MSNVSLAVFSREVPSRYEPFPPMRSAASAALNAPVRLRLSMDGYVASDGTVTHVFVHEFKSTAGPARRAYGVYVEGVEPWLVLPDDERIRSCEAAAARAVADAKRLRMRTTK